MAATQQKIKKSLTTVTLQKPDIFQSLPKIAKIKKSSRAFNVLNRKPGDYAAVPAVDLVQGFFDDPISHSAAVIASANTPVAFDALPYYEEIPLHQLQSSMVVQRPLCYRRIAIIIAQFDERKVQYVNVLRIKHSGKYHYYVTDGQHTAVAYGVVANQGRFSPRISAKNWKNVPVRCQVVDCDNFTFAREHFLGINGDDKLALAAFDKWQNYVLAKRQDSPNDITRDSYENAFAKQVILEKYGIIPTHIRDLENLDKPGAFTRVDLLDDLSEEEVDWFASVHKLNWDDRAVDASEVLPMVNLRHKLKGSKSLSSPEVKKFIVTLGNIIRHIAGSPEQFKILATNAYKEWYKISHPNERKVASTPHDASLALLLMMYREHGGTFKQVSTDFLNAFDDNGYTIFHALDQDLQNLVSI